MRGPLRVLLVALVACGRPVERGDTRPAVKAASSGVWAPGDPIPGWADYDCPPIGQSGDEIVVTYPTVYSAISSFLTPSVQGPSGAGIELADCEDADCIDRSPYASFTYYVPLDSTWLGTGEYSSESEDSYTRGDFYLMGMNPYYEYYGDYVTRVDLCVSRVRPDQLAGSVWFYTDYLYDSLYGEHHYAFSFQVDFPDHGGYSSTGDPKCTVDTGPSPYQYYDYHDVPYDDAWPWDTITDLDIRDEVYSRYYPCANSG